MCGELCPITKKESKKEIFLEITEIINHPDFTIGSRGGYKKGPYGGSDIAVYKVRDNLLKTSMEKRKLWPACLPKSESSYPDKKGVWVGWDVPEPLQRFLRKQSFQKGLFMRNNIPKQVQLEPVPCEDPAWMNSKSFYPAGTQCFRDPSFFSVFDWGNSGSGVIRKFDQVKGTDR